MNKLKVNDVIVVEGKTDKQFLLSFIDSIILETNGSAISKAFLNELKEISRHQSILVITDPDSPGEKIRNTIIQILPESKHIYLDKTQAIHKNKVGLAQCSKDYILEKLKEKISFKRNPAHSDITLHDLLVFGLIGTNAAADKRFKLCDSLHIAPCNGKQLLQKLHWMNISKEMLKKYLSL